MSSRGTFRDVRSAPWQAAAPLALVVIAVICAGLVVADAGGWRQIVPSDTATTGWYAYDLDDSSGGVGEWLNSQFIFDGARYFTGLAGLLVVAALAAWRWLTVGLLAALAAVLAGWAYEENHLGYLSVVFHQVPSGSDYEGQIETSITMSGAVGLLLFFGLLTALVWAVTGTLARRRSTKAERAAMRRPWRTSARIGLAAVAITLVAPRAANILAHAANDFFGVSTDPDFAEDGQQTMYLLFTAIAATYLSALLLPRRRPAGAVALVIVGAALWIPTVWMFGGLPPLDALEGVIDEGPAALLMWLVTVVGGFAISARIVARASRAAYLTATRPDGDSGSGADGSATPPGPPADASAAAATGT